MNKIKSIYKKNEEVTRLLVIMAVWLIFMAFTWLWAVCYA